jgi:hypothetical protein
MLRSVGGGTYFRIVSSDSLWRLWFSNQGDVYRETWVGSSVAAGGSERSRKLIEHV